MPLTFICTLDRKRVCVYMNGKMPTNRAGHRGHAKIQYEDRHSKLSS